MDRENVKGFAEKTKGNVKEGAGKLMGDKGLEIEGKADKAKGDAHNVAGNINEVGRDTADSLKKENAITEKQLAAFRGGFFSSAWPPRAAQ